MTTKRQTDLATRLTAIRDLLYSEPVKRQLGLAAPKHLTPDRIARICLTTVTRTPELAECSQSSLLGALITCTQLGLEPDSVSGHAYLIPFTNKDRGKEVQLIIGYRGLRALALRHEAVLRIESHVVYERDQFEYQLGTNPFIAHKPKLGDRGEMVGVYAVAFMAEGGAQTGIMSRDEVDKIRARSKARGFSPWQTDYEEMARKTVERRICKRLPSSTELQRAVGLDEAAERGDPQDFEPIDVEIAQPEPQSLTERAKDKARRAGKRGAGTDDGDPATDGKAQDTPEPEAPEPTDEPETPANEPDGPYPSDDTPIGQKGGKELHRAFTTIPDSRDRDRMLDDWSLQRTSMISGLSMLSGREANKFLAQVDELVTKAPAA